MTTKRDFDTALKIPFGQAPAIPFKDARKDTPDRFGNAWSLVGLAFVSGLVAWIAGIAITIGLRSLGVELRLGSAGLMGGLTMITVLGFGLRKIFKDPKLVTTTEIIIGHDLRSDGPGGLQQSTVIELHNDRGGWQRLSLPFTPEMALAWGSAYLQGQSTAYSNWADQFAMLPDGSDGEDNYRQFRQALVRAKLARENGTHSISLTRQGAELFSLWVEQDQDNLTPLLAGGPAKRLDW